MKTVMLFMAVGLVLLFLSFLPWTAASKPAGAIESAVDIGSDSAAYGRQLFFAKGCTGCHRHAAVPLAGQFVSEGPPNLTGYDPDPAFVRRWLDNPQAIRPGSEMPDLNMTGEEIEALIAYLDDEAGPDR